MVEAEKLSAPGSFTKRSQVFPSKMGVGEPLQAWIQEPLSPLSLPLGIAGPRPSLLTWRPCSQTAPPHPNLKPLFVLFPVPERPCPPC